MKNVRFALPDPARTTDEIHAARGVAADFGSYDLVGGEYVVERGPRPIHSHVRMFVFERLRVQSP